MNRADERARTIVAFAGHTRPEDVGDVERAGAALDRAFAMIREATGTQLMLLTGAAAGADALAAERWQGIGPVARVHPFVGAHRSLREVVAAHAAPEPSAAGLRALLAGRAVPQVDEAPPPSRLDATLWGSYALFRRLFGGFPPVAVAVPAPPVDLAAQPGFR